ncbi:MAG: nitroreductase family protein [Spirochaetota bacterium]
MDFTHIVHNARSIRRFDESSPIPAEKLYHLVDLARVTPSAANAQPLKYKLVSDPAVLGEVFSTLSWAAALPQWSGPAQGERPTGYIIILLDTAISKKAGFDTGIAAATIQFGAAELGYGCCMLASCDRKALCSSLGIASRYEVQLVLALGTPAEQVVLETTEGAEGSVTYFRTADGVHHVPKRRLSDILV